MLREKFGNFSITQNSVDIINMMMSTLDLYCLSKWGCNLTSHFVREIDGLYVDAAVCVVVAVLFIYSGCHKSLISEFTILICHIHYDLGLLSSAHSEENRGQCCAWTLYHQVYKLTTVMQTPFQLSIVFSIKYQWFLYYVI